MADHSILSPSSMERIIACPPSALENAGLPDVETEYAAQGTDAHALCEAKLREYLGEAIENPRENLTYYDQDMEDYTDEYLVFVSGVIEEARTKCTDPAVMVEQRLDMSEYGEGMFGTADCVIVAEDNLHIIDFKYGTGVKVSAGDDRKINAQLACYALGALLIYDCLYEIETVTMTVFQPRLDNISSVTVDKVDLLRWGEEVLRPALTMAVNGTGEYKAGDHCRFCKIRDTCRKRAEYSMELAKYDFRLPSTLEDEEIEEILPRIDQLVEWANKVKEYALQAALSGKSWDGWKVVEGKSNRKYTDEKAVAKAVKAAGYEPYEQKLLGITDMTKLLGKTRFNSLLGKLLVKPAGKPTLVPITDPRPEMKLSAEEDFKEENSNEE